MMRGVLLLGLSLCLLAGCEAKDVRAPAVASAPDGSSARHGPSVIIKDGSISVGGHRVALGKDIGSWSNALGGTPRRASDQPTVYVWDEYGIQVLTVPERPSEVMQITVYLNLEPRDPSAALFTTLPDGTAVKRGPDLRPKQSYKGGLELDGYEIASGTTFSDIRRHASPSRRLRCGLRDCSHPLGAFNESAGIYLRLTGTQETASVYEFSVAQ